MESGSSCYFSCSQALLTCRIRVRRKCVKKTIMCRAVGKCDLVYYGSFTESEHASSCFVYYDTKHILQQLYSKRFQAFYLLSRHWLQLADSAPISVVHRRVTGDGRSLASSLRLTWYPPTHRAEAGTSAPPALAANEAGGASSAGRSLQ